MSESNRILVWFSCGAASAVAAKAAVMRYGKERPVEVCYCDTSSDEHPDNARFFVDVERWIGQKIIRLSHPKYKTVSEVWEGEGFVAGVQGAPCTKLLKRKVRENYQLPDDLHVLGLTADEGDRIAAFEARHSELNCLWVLAKAGITKVDCYKIIQAAGIELPTMYKLGFNNSNCLGCCKGGMGYHNKIRKLFPDVFAARMELWREIGFNPFQRDDGTRFGLDELTPDMGRDVPEPEIDCGLFCGDYTNLIQLAITKSDGTP